MTSLTAFEVVDNLDLVSDVDQLVAEHGDQRSSLLPILEGLHARHRQITDAAMQLVAERLDISPVEVEGVVTFYHYLGTAPTGRHQVHACRTISCQLGGVDAVVRRLQNETGVAMGETTPDGAVTLGWANCIGMCDQAPALLVDRDAYGNVTPDEAAEIVASLRD